MDRRSFLKNSALGGTAALLLPQRRWLHLHTHRASAH